jgi:hypothetical protein
MEFEKEMNKALDGLLAEQSKIINQHLGKLEDGKLKEFFTSAAKEAKDKNVPFNSEAFAKNAAKLMKDAD